MTRTQRLEAALRDMLASLDSGGADRVRARVAARAALADTSSSSEHEGDELKARAEKAERERDVALNGFSRLVEASDAALVSISAERQRVTVALAAAQARERELRRYAETLLALWRDEAHQRHAERNAPAELEALTRVNALNAVLEGK